MLTVECRPVPIYFGPGAKHRLAFVGFSYKSYFIFLKDLTIKLIYLFHEEEGPR
jgi:hypothetical protein